MVILARARVCLMASTGPRPMISGLRPVTPLATTRARGVMPSSRARVSLITTTAAAPSLSGQALPAVMVPPSRKTGMISRSKKPDSWAATARFWDSRANSSWASRLTCLNSATFSAVWPMAM